MLFVPGAAYLRAQDIEAEEAREAEHAHHTIGLFLGSTGQDRRTKQRRTGGTLGLEYEYRFGPSLGVGAVAEYARGDFDTIVLVAPVAHHAEAWKFYAGPGVEISEEGREPLLRVGVEYGFEVGEMEISPQIDVDFVGGEHLFIFGVVFARRF